MAMGMIQKVGHLIRYTPFYTPLSKLFSSYQRLLGANIIKYPTYSIRHHRELLNGVDEIRSISIALALKRIETEGVLGDLAEAGVYRGYTSKIIHFCLPERTLYLFDTFCGFPDKINSGDKRFSDTGIDIVKKNIGDYTNIVFCQGFFPSSAANYEHLKFAFVMLDMDRYESTRDGLGFFYPRLSPRGYIFLHDYNSPESDYGVSRATNEFMAGKPEGIVDLPDRWGSVVIRKI